jgi:hypothetical protein
MPLVEGCQCVRYVTLRRVHMLPKVFPQLAASASARFIVVDSLIALLVKGFSPACARKTRNCCPRALALLYESDEVRFRVFTFQVIHTAIKYIN